MNLLFQLHRRSLPIDGESVRGELAVESGAGSVDADTRLSRRSIDERYDSCRSETKPSGNRTSAVPFVELAMARCVAI